MPLTAVALSEVNSCPPLFFGGAVVPKAVLIPVTLASNSEARANVHVLKSEATEKPVDTAMPTEAHFPIGNGLIPGV